MFWIFFCYLHLRNGNLLQKLWKYYSFQEVKSLYSGNVGKFEKFGWGSIFTCQGIFGLFLQNIYPWGVGPGSKFTALGENNLLLYSVNECSWHICLLWFFSSLFFNQYLEDSCCKNLAFWKVGWPAKVMFFERVRRNTK